MGTHKAKGPEVVQAVRWALQAGYRHIGTSLLTSLCGLSVKQSQLGALAASPSVSLLASEEGRRPHTYPWALRSSPNRAPRVT